MLRTEEGFPPAPWAEAACLAASTPASSEEITIKCVFIDFLSRSSVYDKVDQKYYEDFRCHNILVNGS